MPAVEGQQPRHRKHRSRGVLRGRRSRKALLRGIGLLPLLILANAFLMIVIKFVNSPSG